MSTIFVGDVHGCAEEFEELLERVDFDSSKDRLFLTGDAFAKGPAPTEVWRLIQQSGARMVLGNHEIPILEHLQQASLGQQPVFRKQNHRIIYEKLTPLADRLLPWMKGLPLFVDETDFLLVHAGINPVEGLQGTTRDQFLTIRTWPPRQNLDGPRWHNFLGPATRPVIFGHDALGGLVFKCTHGEHRPYAVGLDSGCVYGGLLSAYLLETNEIFQVRSRQPPV